ncbi:MAG: hypothetical protein IJM83_02750 [Firmicutes bacterium]|nr:hypothetical protein [Bacillota bacterium]
MKTNGTYFVNDPESPLRYGEINLINPPRQRLRGEELREGIPAYPVFCGFCGTDLELMRMGQRRELGPKFPEGEKRLINGHEGVVWVPSENRFAIVLIRGGDSYDPTRFTEDETYFEYGCDGADGLFSEKNYFHPDMLLHLPEQYEGMKKLPLQLAKRLVFCDPYACAIFQHERLCDLGAAQNFRVLLAKASAKEKADGKAQVPEKAPASQPDLMAAAVEATFARTVIYGLGTTGLFIGDQIRRNHPDARILFVARSRESSEKVQFTKKYIPSDYLCADGISEKEISEAIRKRLGGTASLFVGTSGSEAEHRIAFAEGALGNNGIYDSFSLGPHVSFDSMPFGFKNQLIFASINFRQAHMEEAIRILSESHFDEIVRLIDKEEFIRDPMGAYLNKIYAKGAPLKTAVIWNKEFVE